MIILILLTIGFISSYTLSSLSYYLNGGFSFGIRKYFLCLKESLSWNLPFVGEYYRDKFVEQLPWSDSEDGSNKQRIADSLYSPFDFIFTYVIPFIPTVVYLLS